MFSIYLVDDDPLILDNLSRKTIWQECGFEVGGSNISSVAALREIVRTRPDAVMCDLKMPSLDGISLMAQVQSQGVASDFIMLSAYASFEDSRNFFTNHGFDYLLKPVDEMELQITLERLARRLIKKTGEAATEEDSAEQATTIDAIMSYLRRNYKQRITLSALSELFHLNPNYICNLFVKHYGQTFTSIVTSQRMKEAVRMIQNTGQPMKAIAAECGYANYFYFCRVFKEYYGCTPGDYKG